jgi:hypothetical protein
MPVRAAYWDAQWFRGKLAVFRQHVTLAGFEELVRERLASRERNFLWSVEHLIFANPDSPYRPLLELAGYDLPKLRALVLTQGLDAALDQLRKDGVYVRVREFKGMEAAVRRGRTYRFQQEDFANPQTRGVMVAQSSGSRSGGTRTDISMASLLDGTRRRRWLLEGYGLWGRDVVFWGAYGDGLLTTARYTTMGRPPLRWICYHGLWNWKTTYLIKMVRLATGLPVPQPEAIPTDRVLDVARYISRANTPRGIQVNSSVSSALRLVLAAEEASINLGDVAFWISGEPLTPLKRRQFEERGSSVYSLFMTAECGEIACQCPVGEEADDLHVLTDLLALRQYQRAVDQDGATVPAYLVTSLLPHAPHVMVNVEVGDYGGLVERRCGCFLDRLGFHLHVHTIRSFEKLTAEAMTYMGPGLITLVEEILPREFGGDMRHYQFVEGEDGQGFTRLYVLASPQLGEIDNEALRNTVLRELGQLSPYESIWGEARTIQVLRREPLATASGKVLHLHRDRGALWASNGGQSDG